MKHIIVAFDGLNFSAAAAKYAVSVASSAKAHVTGVFLDDYAFRRYRIYNLIDREGVSEEKLKQIGEQDEEMRKKSVKEFEKICRQSRVKYKVRHDRNTALDELSNESIYADLIVIDKKGYFCPPDENAPCAFLREALNNTESPALVVPSAFKAIHKLIFLYDGSPVSVNSIKSFGYLFETFHSLPLEIVTVKQTKDFPDLSGKYLMNDWIKKYFSDVTYKLLEGDPESMIIQYTGTVKSNPLLIFGARSRGRLSYLFRPSMADTLTAKLEVPLFIVRY